MKLNLQYGNDVIVLPGAAFPDKMPPDASYLYVLLILCKNRSLLSDAENLYREAAAVCRLPENLVRNAVAYWLEMGVLTQTDAQPAVPEVSAASSVQTSQGTGVSDAFDETEAAENPEASGTSEASDNTDTENAKTDTQAAESESRTAPPERPFHSTLPEYPAGELARIIAQSKDLRPILDECARIAGKIFSEHECAQVAALYDAYGMDGAYLLTVFMYCKNMGKTSVAYVVKTALGLYDDGIRTVEELEAHIAARERSRDNEYQIRRRFGLGERALTTKEKAYIEDWLVNWKMPIDVIMRAYDITVETIEKPRMSYINKILLGWNENGIRTLEAVDAANAAFREKQQNGAEQQNAAQGSAQGSAANPTQRKPKSGEEKQDASYDIDEFLELAMKRSFDQM